MTSLHDPIADMRKPYKGEQELFTEDDLVSREPFGNFQAWFDVTCNTKDIAEPNAMSIATVSSDGKPSVRVVLMKGFNKQGFKFYTNYDSHKGKDLTSNPHAALCFYWTSALDDHTWARQINIEGTVKKISQEESDAYFKSRPRGSQIGACVSPQSTVIASRQVLQNKEKELKEKYADESIPIPRPDNWGGFLLEPSSIEFWQGQTTRLHDRIRFRRPKTGETINPETTHTGEDGWVYERLAP